jgi:dihydrofolate synthase/folylpolyglutamate synthase
LRVEVAKQRLSEGHRSSARRATAADRAYSLTPDSEEPDPAYRSVLEWIWSFSARARTADQMASQRAVKLERMRALLHLLGDPHASVPSVLVAGSKGKGSTVAMLAACLEADGRRTGRYTSPHLVNWRERTTVDGEPISTEAVIALAEPIRAAVAALPDEFAELTTFEVGTAFAFLYFARTALDIAVLEVGVGGRFDATNLVEPLVSVITPISYEHTATLGPTLAAIAEHKAGILRTGRPGIIAPQPEEARRVIERVAREVGAPLVLVSRDRWWRGKVGLLGDHQRDNATTAVAALHALGGVSEDAIRAGLEHVEWPGRLQLLRSEPWLVLDGAHNAASAQVLRQAIDEHFEFERLSVVLGLTAGKDAQGVLEALGPRVQRLRLTRSRHERSADPAEISSLARSRMPNATVSVHPEFDAAVEAAMAEAGPKDLVLVTGSLFLVGEALL